MKTIGAKSAGSFAQAIPVDARKIVSPAPSAVTRAVIVGLAGLVRRDFFRM
jgi:hypothetical protein